MSQASKHTSGSHQGQVLQDLTISVPTLDDGPGLYQLASNTTELDLNSPYMYLLLVRDFAETCRIVLDPSGNVVGYVLAYRRPAKPDTLFIWQIAVDRAYRGKRFAIRMLDDLIDKVRETNCPINVVEATVTQDNVASSHMFETFTAQRDASLQITPLFDEGLFPAGHDTEYLFEIKLTRT